MMEGLLGDYRYRGPYRAHRESRIAFPIDVDGGRRGYHQLGDGLLGFGDSE